MLAVIISALTSFIVGVGLAAFTEFDTVFGDMATWMAAIGTVSTLFFAIRQNKQIRLEQKKDKKERKIEEAKQRQDLDTERKKREEHEKEQLNMWAEQKQMLTFQKYETHFKLYNQLLDRIESEDIYQGIYIFPERTQAYRLLFPNNSLINCELDFSASTDDNFSPIYNIQSVLEDIRKLGEQIANNETDNREVFNFFAKIYYVTNAIGAQIRQKELPGTICLGKNERNSYFNISQGLDCLLALRSIINELRRFANLAPLNEDLIFKIVQSFTREKLYFQCLEYKNKSVTHEVISGSLNALPTLTRACSVLKDTGLLKTEVIIGNIFPQAKPDYLKQLNNKEFVANIYHQIVSTLKTDLPSIKDEKSKVEITILLEDLNDLIKTSNTVDPSYINAI
jgi:hypothetical protein